MPGLVIMRPSSMRRQQTNKADVDNEGEKVFDVAT
jgi:hypothetical protein